MNKNKLFILAFVLCFSILSSQTFTGIYIFKINSKVPTQTYNSILSSQNKTWFVETKQELLIDTSETKKTSSESGLTVEHISDDYKNIIMPSPPEYYKDSQTDNMLSRNFYLTKACYIKENLDQFTWKISDETVTYNGKKYNEATTEFRGKTWIVYFDPKVSFNIAPWKFYGLPGVIVYAKTTDNLYTFELKEYKIVEKNTPINNPFEKEKLITWDQYKENYKEYLKKLIKKWSADSEDGNGGSIKMDNTIEDLGFTEIK
ncbi:GLPGLI family protein [Chryseobacterium sp. IT-36CA2]|uniref:GLPGLI family protein n=1 Tax=Chryseobacterium sp. IT-36CA2 TaxID=3026460 RepID=UPI0039E0CE70